MMLVVAEGTAGAASRIEALARLFIAAFTASEGPTEGELIGRLVREMVATTTAPDWCLFAASEATRLVGAVLYSRLRFDAQPSPAVLLSPAAVHPGWQGKGVGQRLIAFSLGELRHRGVQTVFTYGDIRFYSRVGFRAIAESVARAPLPLTRPEGWLAQALTGDPIGPFAGIPRCVEAIRRPEYW
jgi:putative acetyltransferase